MAKQRYSWIQQPSWWIVLIAGALFVTFSVAIIRELVNGHQVRQQAQRLKNQVATEQERQTQLQDLIDYLGSPTFQEQEARLKLGLKKTGERVIVVPVTNNPVEGTSVSTTTESVDSSGQKISRPQSWWNYFFAPRSSSSSPKV